MSTVKLTTGAVPPSNNPSDFPALLAWFKFMEGTGTALTDDVGNVSAMTLSGTGTHWNTPHALNLAAATADIATTPLSNVTFPAFAHGDVLLFEFDLIVPTGGGGQLIEIGRRVTGVQTGFGSIGVGTEVNTGEVRNSINLRNTTWNTGGGLVTDTTFHNRSKFPIDSRQHVLSVIDLTDPDGKNIVVRSFNDGIERAQMAIDTTSLGGFLTGNFMQNNDYRIGERNDGAANFTGQIYNHRVWRLSSYPTNMLAIATEMAANPNELPQLLRGIS